MKAKIRIMHTFLIILFLFIAFPVSVFAAYDIDYRIVNGADNSGTDYIIIIKVANVKNAGTDGDGVKVKFTFYEGIPRSFELDQPSKDDLEKNDLCRYIVKIDQPPYMLEKVEIINKSTDGLCIEYLHIYVKDAIDKKFSYGEKWIEGKDTVHADYVSENVSKYTKRIVSGAGNFNEVFNKVLYFEEGINYGTKTIDFNWDGKISDQYGSNYQFNTLYKSHIPELKASLIGNGFDNKYTVPTEFITFLSPAPYHTGFSIDEGNISKQMIDMGINKLSITPTLTYKQKSTHPFNGGYSFSGKVEIIRKNFEISKISVVNDNEAFKAYNNNNYFNTSANQIKLQLEVRTGINNDNYNAEDIAKNISGEFHLLYNRNYDYIEPIEIKSEGKYIYLTFNVPQDNDDDSSFLKLKMHGVTSKSGNVEVYKLLNLDGKYEETVIRDISEYKVDTKKPEISLSENISGTWNNTIEFGVTSNENLYPKINTPRNEKDAGYFTYTLYDSASYASKGENATSISIKGFGSNSGRTGSHVAPRSDSTKIKLQLMNKEEGSYVLALSGYDYAGNRTITTYHDIRLDNKAPYIAINAIEHPLNTVDKSRTAEYRFTLSDASETGLVYYCFVKDGDPIPSLGSESNVSGKIDAVIGEWAFIEQTHSPTTTIILKLNKGESFKGRLYYFAKDSSENSTTRDNKEVRQNGIDFATGFNYTEINFNNQNIDHSIIIGSYSYPQSNYNISFDYTLDSTIKYRWIGYTPSRTYINQNIGSGLQLNGSNQEILLNGECTLEYTITASNGNYAIYTKSFVFDNKTPDAYITIKNSGAINTSHTFILNASDISGIKSASYFITDADNVDLLNPPFVYTEGIATINNGIVNTSVSLENVKSGAYVLVFTAEDNNGLKTVVQSSPVYIRSSAPEVQARANFNNTLGDFYVSSENDYTVSLVINEPMNAAKSFMGNQYVKYRVSADGINYSEWINGKNLDFVVDGLYAEFNINSPIALNEGENTVYIQIVNSSFTDNLTNIMPNMITSIGPIKIFYDPSGPDYSILVNDKPTRDNIIGTIILQDTVTNNEGMSLVSQNSSIIVSEPIVDELTGIKNKYTITITDNVNDNIIATDKLGNETIIPIIVTSIDREAPEVSITIEYPQSESARIDAKGFIFVNGAVAGNTRFALIDEEKYNNAVTEEDFNNSKLNLSVFMEESYELNDGISNSVYSYNIRGLSGNYKINVYAVDQLGNSIEGMYERITVQDAQAQIIDYRVASDKVMNNATVLIDFNVPVYLLPNSLLQTSTKEGMTIDELNEELALSHADNYSMTQIFVVPDNGVYKLYAADECGRSYTFEITVSDVLFNQGVPYSIELKNDFNESLDINEIHIDDANYGNTFLYISFNNDMYDNYVLVPVINEPEASLASFTSFATTGSGIEAKWFSEENQDFGFENGLSQEYFNQMLNGYSTLVYSSKHTNNFDKKLYFIIREYELSDDGQLVWKQDNYESLILNCLDSTAPTINYSLSTSDITSESILVSLMSSDSETGISSLRYFISDVPHDYQGTGYLPVDNEVVEVVENSYLFIIAENGVGMENKIMIEIRNIINDPISYGEDYIVSYEYQDFSGNWLPIADEVYYKNARAVVEFLNPDRGMYVVNNSGSNEHILTAFDNSFEFELTDKYGYNEKYQVLANNFDLSSPKISYNINNIAKTNQPVNITIIASDEKSGIADVKLETKDNHIITLSFERMEGENYIYSATIENSGTYIITAYDNIGNKATKSFIVSNIDKNAPAITGLSYSTRALTNQSVSVQITGYTKPGVTITKTEPIDPLTISDYQVSISNNLISFTENGSISVFFKDEYGNEGAEIIEVDNIYREPPSLLAVAETADNQLSVKVRFEMEMVDGVPVDKFRKLSDLFVSYNGIVYRADNAEFTLTENRKYSFKIYDVAGMIQYIDLNVSDIDKSIPKITEVSWSYYYYKNEEQKWELIEDSIIPGTEAGYKVANDIYPATSRNVIVKVKTDKITSYIGAPKDDEPSLNHELEYMQNGLFNFNLKSANELSASYAVEIAIIDKTPPSIEFINPLELMFIEGGTTYDKELLNDFVAYDVFNGVKTILSEKVIIDWGGFDPDNINNNAFDRSNPYYITYKVYDSVGNYTEFRRTIVLVGFNDTVALINGIMPDTTSSVILKSDSFDISLYNFSGTAYVKYATGQYTMGQMKTRGTVIFENSGAYSLKELSKGWYTIFIQTDKRDYFTVYVYVSGIEK